MLKSLLSKAVLATTLGHGVPLRYAVPVYTAGMFDASTTQYSLLHCPTCREVNPLYRPVAKSNLAYPVMLISDSAFLYMAHKLTKHHKRIAKVLYIGATALHVYDGISNIKVVQRYGK